MESHKQLIDYVLMRFMNIEKHLNCCAVVVDEGWHTSIVYPLEPVGIELEIDWREYGIFLLVVRLHNGKMPEGYYESDGREGRVHLLNIAKKMGWNVPPQCVDRIRRHPQQQVRYTTEYLMQLVDAYAEILTKCIDAVSRDRDRVFSE